jgi:hypothetical protein
MGKRSRRGAGNVPPRPASEPGECSTHAVRPGADVGPHGRPGHENGESDRGRPGVDGDPYQDEGGEG